LSPPRSEPIELAGTAGRLEALLDDPGAAAPEACMVVCHPHPLHGGTMTNKVVTTLARCANDLGLPALRFNYRGVGASAGSFDEGVGETEDALAAVAYVRQRWPQASVWLAGFSFGGHVALRASTADGAGQIARLVTVAPAFTRYYESVQQVKVPACPWLVIQGDADDVIDAAAVIDWSRRISPPPQLVVLPGVGHFFHGSLTVLAETVTPFLR